MRELDNPEPIENVSERQLLQLSQLDRASRIASYLQANLPKNKPEAVIQVPVEPGSETMFAANRSIQSMAEHMMYDRVTQLTDEGHGKVAWDIIHQYFKQPDKKAPAQRPPVKRGPINRPYE